MAVPTMVTTTTNPAPARRLFVGLAGENRGKKPPVCRGKKPAGAGTGCKPDTKFTFKLIVRSRARLRAAKRRGLGNTFFDMGTGERKK